MTEGMLTVVIPSREDSYLVKTVEDLLDNARGPVEVVIVLDGYWPKGYVWDDDRVVVVHIGSSKNPLGMRACINTGMRVASGEYVMKTDEHCSFEEGFDVKLKADCGDDWVVVPRRYRLDADKWEIIEDGRPPIDYMYIENKGGYLHGTLWNEMHYKKKDILIDDLMTFQGSCYFMKKKFWGETIGPMDDANYGPFSNEAQEIGNKAWLSGGRVIVNKKTWYAHWHRDRRGYGFTNEQQRRFNESKVKGRAYCADFWLNDRWDKRVRDYKWLLDKFGIKDK